ncbi:MAG: transketolase [Tenericutes bacterium]|nr:transketolase [Mycoplasmatota bacterium]
MEKTIQSMKFLGLDMINQANSGHPGIVLGAANTVYNLYTKHMNANPEKPMWFNRDRFILSAGHGSALLYSTLHLAGYDISMEDIKDFRQLNSITPGHPEYRETPGVDSTTGPLGQGMSMAVGNAIAESYLAAKFNTKEFELVNHYTYALCGDGDMQEGITMESMSIAGRFKLNKLIVLFDSNDIQLDGPVKNANSDDIEQKVKSMNWDYQIVRDPDDFDALNQAINNAKNSDKPSFIEVKTIIGEGASSAGTSESHGKPIGVEETEKMKKAAGYDNSMFEVYKDAYEDFENTFGSRGKKAYKNWIKTLEKVREKNIDLYKQFMEVVDHKLSINFAEVLNVAKIGMNEATRATMGKLIAKVSEHIPHMIGGSADLTASTKAKGIDGDFDVDHRTGRNINFGVREHAMAGIVNGMTLHGLKAFSGGFFIFSDYMKPAMRIAALMQVPSIFIFTHDSVGVGEDGPTHEPVEQLTMFRAMPNTTVIRPGNAFEVEHALRFALEAKKTPTVIVLSRQNIATKNRIDYEKFRMGAYIVKDYDKYEAIFIATGSELELALEIQDKLATEHNVYIRVVSMPSQELFMKQPKEIQDRILPKKCKNIIAIEMGASLSWYRFANKVYGIDEFGRSGKGEEVIEFFGFTADKIIKDYLKE